MIFNFFCLDLFTFLKLYFLLFYLLLGQEKVYKCLGTDVLTNAFKGYNACLFAYGQTGECIKNVVLPALFKVVSNLFSSCFFSYYFCEGRTPRVLFGAPSKIFSF